MRSLDSNGELHLQRRLHQDLQWCDNAADVINEADFEVLRPSRPRGDVDSLGWSLVESARPTPGAVARPDEDGPRGAETHGFWYGPQGFPSGSCCSLHGSEAGSDLWTCFNAVDLAVAMTSASLLFIHIYIYIAKCRCERLCEMLSVHSGWCRRERPRTGGPSLDFEAVGGSVCGR